MKPKDGYMQKDTIENFQHLISEMSKPLTTIEARKYLGVSASTLYKYTHNKIIPFFKPTGRKNYFLKKDLDSFILGKRCSTNQEIQILASLKGVK